MIKPLRDLICITLDDKEETTESGLFITKAWEDAITTGTIEVVGPEVKDLKAGDRIRFNPYATHPGPEENQRFIRQKDVLAHVG